MHYLSFYVQLFLFLVVTILSVVQVADASPSLNVLEARLPCQGKCSEWFSRTDVNVALTLYFRGNGEVREQ